MINSSEANMDTTDVDRMLKREKKIPDFSFEDKFIPNQIKSHITIMVHKPLLTRHLKGMKTTKTHPSVSM